MLPIAVAPPPSPRASVSQHTDPASVPCTETPQQPAAPAAPGAPFASPASHPGQTSSARPYIPATPEAPGNILAITATSRAFPGFFPRLSLPGIPNLLYFWVGDITFLILRTEKAEFLGGDLKREPVLCGLSIHDRAEPGWEHGAFRAQGSVSVGSSFSRL